jgi:hypothetical protein
MQKDKHNIYSREELLKMIKDGTPLPENADAFDLEALEGLKLLKDSTILPKLDAEVDKILLQEKKKETRKKTIYYFSAAASLLLIIGLVFLFKNEAAIKNDKVVAQAEKPKAENMQLDLPVPAPAESKPAYESKEQETVPEKPAAKKATHTSVSQSNASPGSADEEKTAAKDFDRQSEEKNQTSNGYAAAVKESKAAAPQAAQEQAPAADENRISANTYGAGSVNDKSKQKNDLSASSPQPLMQSFSKSAKEEEASLQTKKVVAQKNKNSALFYADEAAKKTTAKNYKEPEFIGGDSTFAAYAKQNLKISSSDHSGIMVVSFLVNKKGEVENIVVTKPLSDCEACSKDVIDLIKSVKKWQPAVMNGEIMAAPKKLLVPYN